MAVVDSMRINGFKILPLENLISNSNSIGPRQARTIPIAPSPKGVENSSDSIEFFGN